MLHMQGSSFFQCKINTLNMSSHVRRISSITRKQHKSNDVEYVYQLDFTRGTTQIWLIVLSTVVNKITHGPRSFEYTNKKPPLIKASLLDHNVQSYKRETERNEGELLLPWYCSSL